MLNVNFEVTDVEKILEFRQAMLWSDMPLSHVMLPEDGSAIHICSRLNGKIIAAGSFFVSGNKAQLRKLAVHPEHRGKGLGKQLITFGSNLVLDNGAILLWCDAREEAIGFYECLGFAVETSVYIKSGVSYRRASIDLL